MNRLPIGIQVYGLRDLLEDTPNQFKTVMQKIKEIGYDGVELAGLYGLEPEYVRDILNEIGLIPISAHVPLAELIADVDLMIKKYQTIGCEYLAIPYLSEEYRPLAAGYETVIKEMTRIGRAVSRQGMTLLYHNHDFEFVRMSDGSYGLDDIYQRIETEYLKAELDTCWIDVAGEKPDVYLRRYLNRCPIVHLKDYINDGNPKNMYKLIGLHMDEQEDECGVFEFRPVGFGQQVWEPILCAAVDVGASWVIVEQDEHYELSSLECARRSRDYLKILDW